MRSRRFTVPRRWRALLGLCCAAAIAHSALAQTADDAQPIETSKTFGAYTVLYNTFPSLDLRPEVAADYRIVRAGDNVVINVALRSRADGGERAQAAVVTGTYSDLIQSRPLEFREIREQDAIYYLAQVRVNNRETLRFDLKLQPLLDHQPAPAGSPFTVTFARKFYVD